jgi:hypothetical protein
MPKASVYKHQSPAAGKNDIRLTGQFGTVQTEAKPSPMQILPDKQLGRRIPASDAAHISAAFFGTQLIHDASGLDSIGDCCIQYLGV